MFCMNTSRNPRRINQVLTFGYLRSVVSQVTNSVVPYGHATTHISATCNINTITCQNETGQPWAVCRGGGVPKVDDG